MFYCPIKKVDFAALATSTRFSPTTSIGDELTDEKFNNNCYFVRKTDVANYWVHHSNYIFEQDTKS